MIDSPTEVPLQGVSIVIPVCVLNRIGVEFPEHIDETPIARPRVSFASVDMEIDIIDALVRMVNVNWLGSDVKIAEPNGRRGRIKGLLEAFAQAPEPLQLEGVFVGSDFVAR